MGDTASQEHTDALGGLTAPGYTSAIDGLSLMAGQELGGLPGEPLLLSQLVQLLGQRPGYSLLLSDLGALLSQQLRTGIKEKGGLRSMVQRYPQLFAVSGQPGKESVQLLLGGGAMGNAALHLSAGHDKAEALAAAASAMQLRKQKEDEEHESAVQLRGLPYRATPADIKAFLGSHCDGLKDASSIQMILNRDGRPSGFARVQFVSPATARQAKEALHMQRMEPAAQGESGTQERYVEVFMFTERPNKLRFKKTSTGDDTASTEDIEIMGVTATQIIEECRKHMSSLGKGQVLLSMLGVALSPGARMYLKHTDKGLKHLLSQHPEEFLMEGVKGRECISYLPAMAENSDATHSNSDLPPNYHEKAAAASKKPTTTRAAANTAPEPAAPAKATGRVCVQSPIVVQPAPEAATAASATREGAAAAPPREDSPIGLPLFPIKEPQLPSRERATKRAGTPNPAGSGTQSGPGAPGPSHGSIRDLKRDADDPPAVPQTPKPWASPTCLPGSVDFAYSPIGAGVATPSAWGTPLDVDYLVMPSRLTPTDGRGKGPGGTPPAPQGTTYAVAAPARMREITERAAVQPPYMPRVPMPPWAPPAGFGPDGMQNVEPPWGQDSNLPSAINMPPNYDPFTFLNPPQLEEAAHQSTMPRQLPMMDASMAAAMFAWATPCSMVQQQQHQQHRKQDLSQPNPQAFEQNPQHLQNIHFQQSAKEKQLLQQTSQVAPLPESHPHPLLQAMQDLQTKPHHYLHPQSQPQPSKQAQGHSVRSEIMTSWQPQHVQQPLQAQPGLPMGGMLPEGGPRGCGVVGTVQENIRAAMRAMIPPPVIEPSLVAAIMPPHTTRGSPVCLASQEMQQQQQQHQNHHQRQQQLQQHCQQRPQSQPQQPMHVQQHPLQPLQHLPMEPMSFTGSTHLPQPPQPPQQPPRQQRPLQAPHQHVQQEQPQTIDEHLLPQVTLNGLPESTTELDILSFFARHNLVEMISDVPMAVKLVTTGVATVQMRSNRAAEKAVQVLSGECLANRSFEISQRQAAATGPEGKPSFVVESMEDVPPGIFSAGFWGMDYAPGDLGGSGSPGSGVNPKISQDEAMGGMGLKESWEALCQTYNLQ